MKLLLNERNLIVAMGSSIEYGVWGNVGNVKSWKITNTTFVMDDNFTAIDIGDKEIPTYVVPGEYYYINEEFKLADECPNEYKDRIVDLESQLATQDELSIELYEKQLKQEEINAAYDETLIELYERANA